MYEIDFEVFVDSPEHQGEAFMDYVDTKLYEKYQGNISPAIRAGEPYVSATVESESLAYLDAITPVLKDLEGIGLRIKSFQICEVVELA